MSVMERTLVFMMICCALLDATRALECRTCWRDAENDIGDDRCIHDPLNVGKESCKANPVGMTYVCQTQATFKVHNGKRTVSEVSRNCSLEHQKCNTKCGMEDSMCWMCCHNNECNTFPLSANVTASRARRLTCFHLYIFLVISGLYLGSV